MKSLKSFDLYGYVWRHLSSAGMMGHSTLACPVMGRRSGNRRADRVPRDPPAVRHRRDFRQQSEDWGLTNGASSSAA